METLVVRAGDASASACPRALDGLGLHGFQCNLDQDRNTLRGNSRESAQHLIHLLLMIYKLHYFFAYFFTHHITVFFSK